ncbi:MAG: septum formation initiator family protein [candidate division Zixibacteria bacterium]|nr:septum formation initiator family protein [candidate division Zixibacteria bacterium]
MKVHNPFQSPLRTFSSVRRARGNLLRRPVFWAVALATLGGLAYVFIGGGNGWLAIRGFQREKTMLEKEVSEMEARRLDLKSDLELLKGNPEENARLRFEMERIAREKHGMVRKDELIYRFHPEKTVPTDEADKKP